MSIPQNRPNRQVKLNLVRRTARKSSSAPCARSARGRGCARCRRAAPRPAGRAQVQYEILFCAARSRRCRSAARDLPGVLPPPRANRMQNRCRLAPPALRAPVYKVDDRHFGEGGVHWHPDAIFLSLPCVIAHALDDRVDLVCFLLRHHRAPRGAPSAQFKTLASSCALET